MTLEWYHIIAGVFGLYLLFRFGRYIVLGVALWQVVIAVNAGAPSGTYVIIRMLSVLGFGVLGNPFGGFAFAGNHDDTARQQIEVNQCREFERRHF